MRVQFNNNGLIVGKYSPEVKGAWIPYSGYEYGGFASFEILRHTNYVWEGNRNNQNLWIPGGKTASGSDIYICSVFHVINPGQVYPVAYNIPGKYDGGRCYISYGGLEYGYDQVGSGPGQYEILKRLN
ncbi:hypothetical protein HA402_006401 [Bradysia odoriphaga]|nr:hypothetical protein HA402_006401 [Bradysia odoriphaga]